MKSYSRFSEEVRASLRSHEDELVRFAERVTHLLSVEQELTKVTKGKPFFPYHWPAWNMLVGETNMVVVDLSSWALGFYERDSGGFLRKLRGEDQKALRLQWKYEEAQLPVIMVGPPDPVGERTIRRHVEDVNRRAREEAFGRLFPFGTTRKDQANVPCDADVSGLCDRLEVQFKALHDDRNQHRAHRYERKQPKTAKMLELSDVTKRLQECQVLLADLRFLSSNSTFASYGYDPKAHVDDEYAQDIVDLVLLGDLRTIIDAEYGPSKTPSAEPGFYHQRRIAHYERLHALHDAAGKPEEPFNNRALLPMPTPGA